MQTVAILGGGKIGEALVAGLLRGERGPEQVILVERDAARAEQLHASYGVPTSDVVGAAVAATLVLAVKPQDARPLLRELAPLLGPEQLIVSVMAGVSAAQLEAVLAPGTPVVRCMPNTPALIGEGMLAVSAGAHAGPTHLARATELLSGLGRVVTVPESQLDAVTAVSGSGPAYFFLMVEALIEAAVLVGLPRALATELVVQTAVGSALMMRDAGQGPGALREAVTSPGGTTIAGLRALESQGLRGAVFAAVEAARDRSRELGSGS